MSIVRKGSPTGRAITYKVDGVRIDPFIINFPLGTFSDVPRILSVHKFIVDGTYLPLFTSYRQEKNCKDF